MIIDMVCVCGAGLVVEADDDSDQTTAAWMLINRFANAHVACGFVTSLNNDKDIRHNKSANLHIKEQ